MRILVTGANGQVGHELLRALAPAGGPKGPIARTKHASVGGPEGPTVRPKQASAGGPKDPIVRPKQASVGGPEGPIARTKHASVGGPEGPIVRTNQVSAGGPEGPTVRTNQVSVGGPEGPTVRTNQVSVGGPEGPTGFGSRLPPLLHTLGQTRRSASGGGGDAGCDVIGATREGKLEGDGACERIDLADPDGLRAALDRIAPDLIVNAAAYTAVDRAEDEPDIAQRVNADAVGAIGEWAAKHGARVVHYSTDYVFDGASTRPHREDDATHPLGVYGHSKLAGELALRACGARHLIFRTAWVYAARGHNFLRTMLRLGAERDELRVVDDQVGAPTPASLVADVTALAIARWFDDGASSQQLDGTYHLAAAGQVRWCGFARAIFERAERTGLLAHVPHVAPITTADYPTRAHRPAYSVLDTSKLRATFGVDLPDWQAGLDEVISELAGDGSAVPL